MSAEKKETKAKKPAAKKSAAKSTAKKSTAKKASAKTAATSSKVVARASVRNFRMSPRKARLVIRMIQGKQVEPALQILAFSAKKAGDVALKMLRSAIANAVEQSSVDVDKLWVTGGWVNMGKTMKRYMPAAQGRATPIKKRASHMTVLIGER